MNVDQEVNRKYLRREPIPENYFLIWKDEKMQEWDRFIYNMKWILRTIFYSEVKSYDDILLFYKINFNIIITLDDLKERPYLVKLVFRFRPSDFSDLLLPSNDDFERILEILLNML